jgi:hypothetical protein
MPISFFRWSLPVIAAAITVNGGKASLPALTSTSMGRGIAYFEPPRSIGTPIEDMARIYSGYGLAAKIEGRLRLDTDASLNQTTRELIRRRLAQES